MTGMYADTGSRSGRHLTRAQRAAAEKEKEKALQMPRQKRRRLTRKEKKDILARKEAEAMEADLEETFMEGYRFALHMAEYRGTIDTGVLLDSSTKTAFKRCLAPRRAVAEESVARHKRWRSKLLQQNLTP